MKNRAAGDRFTPTLVGKTAPAARATGLEAVHPHACGENAPGADCGVAHNGSPPRLWGKRYPMKNRAAGDRFTPTLVGKTMGFYVQSATQGVHPHACGENLMVLVQTLVARGSPPRLWGKQPGTIWGLRVSRFTPTLVGKTPRSTAPAASPAVHPHACGENLYLQSAAASAGGSPPRLWGKQGLCPRALLYSRFTPTLVGKTLS